MSKSGNPFLLFDDPYRHNPFVLLGASPRATRGEIDNRGRQREALLAAGGRLPGLEPQKGDCVNAAEALKNPVFRLLFDLMHFGLDDPEGENHDRANRH